MSNMKLGLDHWTTGPLIPLTAFLLMSSGYEAQEPERAEISNMKLGLDHWTTGPIIPLTGDKLL
jgi:hypothetical protein